MAENFEEEFCFHMLSKCINERDYVALHTMLNSSHQDTENYVDILSDFLAEEKQRIMLEPSYKEDFLANFNCLKFVFRGTIITDDYIKTTLRILTGVSDPVKVAAKILLNKIQKKSRKRAASCNALDGPSKEQKLEGDSNGKLMDFENVDRFNSAKAEASLLEPSKQEASNLIKPPLLLEAVQSLPHSDDGSDKAPSEADQTVIDLSVSVEEVEVQTTTENLPPAPPKSLIMDQKLYSTVLEMFPNVSRNYLTEICQGKKYNDATFAEVLDMMLDCNYPKEPARAPSPEIYFSEDQQLTMLKEVLPDADPTFLEQKVEELGQDNVAMQNFIARALEGKQYPTLKQYLRRTQLSAQQRQYTTEFNVERFVELFPDPKVVFEDPDRKSPLHSEDYHYLFATMRKKFPQCYVRDIQRAIHNHLAIYRIVGYLDECVSKGIVKKSKTSYVKYPVECQNIPLLQELAYIEHKQEIIDFIEKKKLQDARDRLEAKEMGLLETCSCCFDDEVMPKDILTCPNGCRFCRSCVKRSSEIAIGEGKIDFPCLSANCESQFSIQVLQTVLAPKAFNKLVQKKAVAEVKAAGIEELESCPFCDFANIPAPEDKLFRCLNPDCMKESCRMCKEPSHVPLRCDEVEKDEAVKARTYIENKMTDALIRECWKCGNRFYKEEGCNKMTCTCGAMTCYVCRKPVTDYSHFNGQGGDRFDLCPLYTDNYNVNEKKVLEAAAIAKQAVDVNLLKHDPTVGLEAQLNIQAQRNLPRAHAVPQMILARHPQNDHHNVDVANQVAQGAIRRHNQHQVIHHQILARHPQNDHHNVVVANQVAQGAIRRQNQQQVIPHQVIPRYQYRGPYNGPHR